MNDDDLWTDGEPREIRRPPRPRRRPSDDQRASRRAESNPRVPTERSGPQPATSRQSPNETDATAGTKPRWVVPAVCLVIGALLGGTGAAVAGRQADDTSPRVTAESAIVTGTSTTVASTSTVVAETTATTIDVPAATTLVPAPAGTPNDDLARAEALAPLTMPSDCGLPFGVPESLPNGARDYRGGVHEGIDFICGERGRDAVAALDGQVVMANQSYVDPENPEREEILATAKALGYTPSWTLAMLFGRVVVIDHGNRPGVGHVVTIYAHLEQIDPAIRPGLHVKAGQRLGEIGNRGTETAATGGTRPQSLHLHWEIHIDGHFLGEGASSQLTDDIYRKLFGR